MRPWLGGEFRGGTCWPLGLRASSCSGLAPSEARGWDWRLLLSPIQSGCSVSFVCVSHRASLGITSCHSQCLTAPLRDTAPRPKKRSPKTGAPPAFLPMWSRGVIRNLRGPPLCLLPEQTRLALPWWKTSPAFLGFPLLPAFPVILSTPCFHSSSELFRLVS